ncbi:MAG TPA: hypothetical protein VJZ00_11060 [Thermoanaerobaculia bacterium]|nr:hypothetical protein [Thermoanaerobaculia bacterium]
MTSDRVRIRVSVEEGHVVFERLNGAAPRNDGERRLRTEIKSLDAFEANVGTPYYLVQEAWGIEPQLVTFVDANGNELHPD